MSGLEADGRSDPLSPPVPTAAAPRPRAATIESGATVAGWAYLLGRPAPEPVARRRLARVGGVVAILSLLGYLIWRIGFTMPTTGWSRVAAWVLVAFEALPLAGLLIRTITLWDIGSSAPRRVTTVEDGARAAVLIPTYNEPVEVIAPTIAAACDLQPPHQTWVLDDGDRPWLADLCREYGARYVTREVHDHAKAGNMNHALDVMSSEIAAGAPEVDILAVLDCDHVPLPTFLTDTIGWFDDPGVALVQAPQSYYNAGAFDDDGVSGEQGVFFHVLMPARNVDGAGPFWCGSTSLIRRSALNDVGGVATETIVEDMHTTLGLIKKGWKTVYHHQVLAVGLAPATAEQYLLQRRRWGMGSMQVLTTERLWRAKRWLSWRNFYEYLSGTLWWFEGVATVLVFVIPVVILLTGAQTSTASPLAFSLAFVTMFVLRMWGTKRLFRNHMHWPTAFALRIFRVPVGLSCLWWLLTRRTLTFQVTPKAGADERLRGRVPIVLVALFVIVTGTLVYSALGVAGVVPWRTTAASTIASGVWLVLADVALVLGTLRITREDYATSRRDAHRFAVRADVSLAGVEGELVDVSVGGAAVRCPAGSATPGTQAALALPGAPAVRLTVVRVAAAAAGEEVLSCRVPASDWSGYRTLSRWLFHTPPGAVEGLPAGVPAAALTTKVRRRAADLLVPVAEADG